MSFKQLKKDVLVQVAEDFAVDLPEDIDDTTKDEIIARLTEDGVTWELYKEAFPSVMDQEDATKAADPEDEPEVQEEPDPKSDEPEDEPEVPNTRGKVLLKMDRANGTFVIRGYKFTKDHPFLPVSSDDATFITENVEGFKIANPKEVDEFYS
jgi:hypothetical protein